MWLVENADKAMLLQSRDDEANGAEVLSSLLRESRSTAQHLSRSSPSHEESCEAPSCTS